MGTISRILGSYKGEQMKYICQNCDKRFSIDIKNIEWWRGCYCSAKCYIEKTLKDYNGKEMEE